jgi:predicted GNAT family N-acyltransferase
LDTKNFSIEQIPPAATLMVRQAELYPKLLLKKLQLDEDEDGIHLGLFHDNKLITVVSLFQRGTDLQFRKFATISAYQKMGFGKEMLKYVFDFATKLNCKRVWCNARISAVSFYQKFGMVNTETTFSKDGIEYVIMEKFI